MTSGMVSRAISFTRSLLQDQGGAASLRRHQWFQLLPSGSHQKQSPHSVHRPDGFKNIRPLRGAGQGLGPGAADFGNRPHHLELSGQCFFPGIRGSGLPESDQNRYAYKLEGFDRIGITRIEPHRDLYQLDPGRYRFRVKGTNNDGIWNEEGASLSITILTPLWKTWWAYGLYLLGLIGVLTGYTRRKSKNKPGNWSCSGGNWNWSWQNRLPRHPYRSRAASSPA